MSRMGAAVLAFIGLTAIALMLVGCDGFFVSPNSLASFAVSPTGAVLSSASGAGNLTLSANGTTVNNNPANVSPNWTSSDTSCAVISFSSPGCTATTTGASVTVTPIAAGAATITASASGQTATVPISVITGTISGITATISPTSVAAGGTITETVAASNGTAIQCQYVNFGTPPTGTTFTCTNNSNSLSIAISSTTSALTGVTGLSQVTIPEPSVTTNGDQTLQPTNFSGTVTII